LPEASVALQSVTVTVPGTTANLGPGFDCLGAALTLYNRFQFTLLDQAPGSYSIRVRGSEAERVSRDSSNLAYRAFAHFYQQQHQAVPAIDLAIDLDVPLARGLGSSSTAIVGGILAANALYHQPLDQSSLVAMAVALEGHPDNVVPALVGGCQLSVVDDQGLVTVCPVPWHASLGAIVVIPNFELATATARQVLPLQYSRADAIFNAAHLGLLLRGLETGNGDWLRVALADRLHQPYRQSLIPGYGAVAAAAIAAGAHGLVISGAGPTLLALAPATIAPQVCEKLRVSWQQQGQIVKAAVLPLQTRGAWVDANPIKGS
jgi:homoserine kinase